MKTKLMYYKVYIVADSLQILSNRSDKNGIEVPESPIFLNEMAGILWLKYNYFKLLHYVSQDKG
jgi:hypothetical protein